MSTGLHEIDRDDFEAELERLLLPWFTDVASTREPGHCMRVASLDPSMMVRLCRALRSSLPEARIHVLEAGDGSVPEDVAVTARKLVELRNPMPDGTTRAPLLVFVPDGVHAAAEDSFGVATFEELDLHDVYPRLVRQLLSGIPNGLRSAVSDLLRRLEEADWPYADAHAAARYLVTVRRNDNDPQAAGAAVFELGLIPDFALFEDYASVGPRLRRNLEAMRTLTYSGRTERARVLELGLTSRTLRARLAEFVAETGLIDPRAWTRRIVVEPENWSLAFHHWTFAEQHTAQDIGIDVVDIALPVASGEESDGRLASLVGQRYLPTGTHGLKKFTGTVRTDPAPARVRGLHRLVAEIVALDGGRVGVDAATRVEGSAKDTFRLNFRLSQATA